METLRVPVSTEGTAPNESIRVNLADFASRSPEVGSITLNDEAHTIIGDTVNFHGTVYVVSENGRIQEATSVAQNTAQRVANNIKINPGSKDRLGTYWTFIRKCYPPWLRKRSRKELLFAAGGFLVLVTIIIGSVALTSTASDNAAPRNIYEIYAAIGHDCQITIVTRENWNANPARESNERCVEKALSVPRDVIVDHTDTYRTCTSVNTCKQMMKFLQDKELAKNPPCDIPYNFLVGKDNNVYEGLGFYKYRTSFAEKDNALTLALMGNYTAKYPREQAKIVTVS